MNNVTMNQEYTFGKIAADIMSIVKSSKGHLFSSNYILQLTDYLQIHNHDKKEQMRFKDSILKIAKLILKDVLEDINELNINGNKPIMVKDVEIKDIRMLRKLRDDIIYYNSDNIVKGGTALDFACGFFSSYAVWASKKWEEKKDSNDKLDEVLNSMIYEYYSED